MPITIGLGQRAMLAIATWFYSRIGMPLTYEVRTRNLNNRRQTAGVLTGVYPTLQEAIERQQRAVIGMRPGFIVTITAVVTVSAHRPMFLNQPICKPGKVTYGPLGPAGPGGTTESEEEVFFNNRFDDAAISGVGPPGKKWTAKAHGTVLTPRSDDGKNSASDQRG